MVLKFVLLAQRKCCLLEVNKPITLPRYLPRLCINYVGMNKDMGKTLPQLYYIMMKISYDVGFIAIGVAMATYWCHYAFYLSLCFSVPGFFWRNRLEEYVPPIIASIMAKFQQILWERFRNILTRSFNNHKNSEIACYPYNSLIF